MISRARTLRKTIAPNNAETLGEIINSFNIKAGTEALASRFDSDSSDEEESEE